MLVRCETCRHAYDDAAQWTLCPHGPLWAAVDAYCPQHDLVHCPLHGDAPEETSDARALAP